MWNSSRTRILVPAVGTVCFLLLTLAAADEQTSREVQIGQWTVAASSEKRFEATSPNTPPVEIEVTPDGEKVDIPKDARELDVPGIGKVWATVDTSDRAMQQAPRTLTDIHVRKEFYYPQAAHWIILRSRRPALQSGGPAAQQPSPPGPNMNPEQFATRAEEEAWIGLENDFSFALLKEMLREEVVLGERTYAADQPTAEASIDGASFVQLKYAGLLKGAEYAWNLPAQPGQRMTFRFTYPCERAVVTTHGIRVKNDPSALRGEPVRLREYPPGHARDLGSEFPWIESAIDKDGVAVVDYGALLSPRLLQMQQGPLRPASRFRHIFLRWGRPEEEWLQNLNPPVTLPASTEEEELVRASVSNLETSYDPDCDAFLLRRGLDECYLPTPVDTGALEGMSLAEWPHLSAAEEHDPLPIDLERFFDAVMESSMKDSLKGSNPAAWAEAALEAAQSSEYRPKLWKDLEGARPGNPSGWHDPRIVYGLAVVWERFPELREKNELERILDYWVDAIALRPSPVYVNGKASTGIDDRVDSHACAVAALHAGHRAFGKPQYLAARDAVLGSMRQLPAQPPETPYYEALAARTWWHTNPGQAFVATDAQRMYDFVWVYGQTCAFIGNEEELEKTRSWIRWALMREGSVQDTPFPGDLSPTFGQRCGMIGVLRGRAAFLAMPRLDTN